MANYRQFNITYNTIFTNVSGFAGQFRPRRPRVGGRVIRATATAVTGIGRRCCRPSRSGVSVTVDTTFAAAQWHFSANERPSMTAIFVAAIATTTVPDGRQQPPLQFLEDAFVCLGLNTR